MAEVEVLQEMAQRLRRVSVLSTSEAGSGHPTTCMSAAEIMSVLFFDEMRWDPARPESNDSDHFILSKGHAAPILWAVLHEAGAIAEDPMTLRRFDSPLEGHPTPYCPWVRVATGSLGQGLSAATGMAIAKRIAGHPSRVFCLLGDGEVAEGSVWEAVAAAAELVLDNLCAIVDVNGLGQSGRTMHGHNIDAYVERFESMGWRALPVDGHDVEQVQWALRSARDIDDAPTAILASTLKGKGFSQVEDREGWHGKPFPKGEVLSAVLAELGDPRPKIPVAPRPYGVPWPLSSNGAGPVTEEPEAPSYDPGTAVATREAYGHALVKLGRVNPRVVALDGDTKNSTFSEWFKNEFPDRFVEAHIAEQNMVGMALGLAAEGYVPFASSFAAFLSRAYDFIRMAAYSRPDHLVICGSHAGVSIGADGASQMALEDLAMMRAVRGSTVLYPSDAVSGERLTMLAAATPGIVYIRSTRPKTPILYDADETFTVGGSKVVRRSDDDKLTVVGAGITLHNALGAADALAADGIAIRVVDLYSVKPVDVATLNVCAEETGKVLVVEDHAPEGGLGEAVAAALGGRVPVRIQGIDGIPRSGTPDELMDHFGISTTAIVKAVRSWL